MKRSQLKIYPLMLTAILALGITACGEKSNDEGKTSRPKTEKNVSALPNYRYVDLDTILSRYNLAKDYSEEMLRMSNNAESQIKQHETKIQNFANQVQNKMQNNGYLSQESYQQDEKTMVNMQNEYQRSAATLQNNLATAAAQAQKTINDSINAFIESYNKTRGYDAIFFKAAALHINPELDITDEVVEGLNARYNKVKK